MLFKSQKTSVLLTVLSLSSLFSKPIPQAASSLADGNAQGQGMMTNVQSTSPGMMSDANGNMMQAKDATGQMSGTTTSGAEMGGMPVDTAQTSQSSILRTNMNAMDTASMNMNGMNMNGMNMAGMNTGGMNMDGMNTAGMNTNEMKMDGMSKDGMNMNGMNMNGMNMDGMKMNGMGSNGMKMNGQPMGPVEPQKGSSSMTAVPSAFLHIPLALLVTSLVAIAA